MQKLTHFELRSPSGYTKIKNELGENIKRWYGGHIQELGNREDQSNEKYGFGHVWSYLREYAQEGIVNEGSCYWVVSPGDYGVFDEQWFLRRVFKSIKISKIF